MDIYIAGAGLVGEFYARHWIAAGHTVAFTHVRDHAKVQALIDDLGPGASWAPSLADAPRPDVAVLASRFHTVDEALDQLGSLDGVVLIDAVNPFNRERNGLEDLGGRTAADVIAAAVAERGGARHVKALHSEGIQRIIDTAHPVALFVASDDQEAADVAVQLIREAGLEPVVTGGLATAALSEPPGPLFGQGYTRDDALAAVEAHR